MYLSEFDAAARTHENEQADPDRRKRSPHLSWRREASARKYNKIVGLTVPAGVFVTS